jgi:hypothetical protein
MSDLLLDLGPELLVRPSSPGITFLLRLSTVMHESQQIDRLQQASNEYMEESLRRTEEAINQSLAEVQQTRARFQSLINKETVEAV